MGRSGLCLQDGSSSWREDWPAGLLPSLLGCWEHHDQASPARQLLGDGEGKEFSTASPGTFVWLLTFSWVYVLNRNAETNWVAVACVLSSPSAAHVTPSGSAGAHSDLALPQSCCSFGRSVQWPPPSLRTGQNVGTSCGDRTGARGPGGGLEWARVNGFRWGSE